MPGTCVTVSAKHAFGRRESIKIRGNGDGTCAPPEWTEYVSIFVSIHTKISVKQVRAAFAIMPP